MFVIRLDKHRLLTLTLLVAAVPGALDGEHIAACTAGRWDQAGYSDPSFVCAIGDKMFANFNLTGNNSAPQPSQVRVTPLAATSPAIRFGPTPNNPQGWKANNSSQTSNAWVRYTATVHEGVGRFIQEIILTASVTIQKNGSAAVAKYLCIGGAFGSVSPGSCSSGAVQSSSLDFLTSGTQSGSIVLPGGITSVGVLDFVSLTGGSGSGAKKTFLNFVDNRFVQAVPEPRTAALVGVALLCLALFKRRLLRRQ